jgi:hypothetical protein
MDDSAETPPQDLSDIERLMATLTSFGATIETHAQALPNLQQRVQQHDQV